MKAPEIEWLLRQLHCDKINSRGDWVYSSCPLARWKHRTGVDKHPSFSVAVDAESISGAKCHACQFSGSLLELLWAVQRYSKKNVDELADFVRANNGMNSEGVVAKIKAKREQEAKMDLSPTKPNEPVYDWDREVAGIKGVQVDWLKKLDGKDDLPVLPDDTLKKFKPCPGPVLDYLTGSGPSDFGTKRRLSPKMISDWEICWDSSYKKIIIPVRDCKKRLVGYSQRSLDPNAKGPKYRHTAGFRRDFYLYGEQFWDEGPSKVCCIVEGFFDAMRLREYGYKAGATMGTHISDFQIEKLIRHFERFIIVPDGDQPGYEAARIWFERLSVRLPATVARTPEGYDPDDFSEKQAHILLGEPQ